MQKRWRVLAVAAATVVALIACGVGAVSQLVQRDANSGGGPPPTQVNAADHGWADRRPIGVVMFCDRGKVTRNNPYGWIEAA